MGLPSLRWRIPAGLVVLAVAVLTIAAGGAYTVDHVVDSFQAAHDELHYETVPLGSLRSDVLAVEAAGYQAVMTDTPDAAAALERAVADIDAGFRRLGRESLTEEGGELAEAHTPWCAAAGVLRAAQPPSGTLESARDLVSSPRSRPLCGNRRQHCSPPATPRVRTPMTSSLARTHHATFKGVIEAAPLTLKSDARIDALGFCLYVALLVHALVERELRRAMAAEGIPSLALYYEDRACATPSAARVFQVLEPLCATAVSCAGQLLALVPPAPDPLQRQILRLLPVPTSAYRSAVP